MITYRAPIDRVPMLVRNGAIIPLAPEDQHYVDEKTSPYTIHIYPKGTGSFDLYEDDGESYDYEKGIHAITKYSYHRYFALSGPWPDFFRIIQSKSPVNSSFRNSGTRSPGTLSG